MARKKKRRSPKHNGQGTEQGRSSVEAAPKSQPGGPSAIANFYLDSQSVKVELPQDFKANTTSMPRGRGRRRLERAIAAAERDFERAQAGLPPTQMAPVAPSSRLIGLADELGLEIDPSADVTALQFKEKRKWRSLGKGNPKAFLKRYEEIQDRKLDPKVFADEATPGQSSDEVAYIMWYQKHRYHYYNSRGRLSDLQTLEKVKNWPNIPNLMTSAPFMRTPPTEHKYVENADNRKRGLFKVLNAPDVAHFVLGDLAEEGFLALSNLSRTCHTGLNIVSQYIESWDETPPGDFLGEDVSVDDDGVQRSPIALVISPIRKASCSRTDISYAEHYETQTKLYRALRNRADLITNLQLHRVQFLDHNAVRCIITSLRNLKLIGIYQCQLLHLGNMDELLNAVKTGRQHKGSGDCSFVDLDFFPMYHEGPNSIFRHGSFGAVWNQPDCDMATGIWQLVLYELYPEARKLGIDILKWGCAFRLFLEKLPMPQWANVRICEAIKSFEYTGHHWVSELDMTAYNKTVGRWERFIDDVTAALRGDGVEPALVPGDHITEVIGGSNPSLRRKYGWWRETKTCDMCKRKVPAVFCPFGEGRCWGCLAKVCLDGDWDHFKTFKAHAAAAWFSGCQDLDDITRDGSADKGYRLAQKIDSFRRREKEHDHCTGAADWHTHADFAKLHRRYAREYEKHGPVDRKLNDRQYMPVGSFPTCISSSLVPACFLKHQLAVDMNNWEAAREEEHPNEPEAERAQLRQKYRDEQAAAIEKNGADIIKQQNAMDAREIERMRQHYRRRQDWPNRQVKCLDELTQDMFYYDAKKRAPYVEVPAWLKSRRPKGPLRW